MTNPESGGRETPSPRPEPRCPLCGGPNGCAVAASGDFATPCWCRDVVFTPELLARVPEAARDRACICRPCAERGAAKAHGGDAEHAASPGRPAPGARGD